MRTLQVDLDEDGMSWSVTHAELEVNDIVRVSVDKADYFILISQGESRVYLRAEYVDELVTLLNNATRWRLQKDLDTEEEE